MEVNKKIYGYDAPQVEVMELYVEGVLCQSGAPEDGEPGGSEWVN
jgi:hypothetical protein